MSFDLDVLAISRDASDADVRAMLQRCTSKPHPEGDLDERIVAFYEQLRARYPDFPPNGEDSPWMSMPLSVGIDHVSMNMSIGQCSNPALEYIMELAERHALTIYDPQFDEVFRP